MGNNRLLFGIDVILIILILWMLVEGMIKNLGHGRDSIVETSQLKRKEQLELFNESKTSWSESVSGFRK
ncbi:MAG: hypothetical protein Ct9H300mP2_2340 [Candidatus Neomarinimicrobiota bacterium]|nr:MAG: hypothetical protein Ct9H300mP2_2340 [Candidatus Neomarinimicrobiota bacterium]